MDKETKVAIMRGSLDDILTLKKGLESCEASGRYLMRLQKIGIVVYSFAIWVFFWFGLTCTGRGLKYVYAAITAFYFILLFKNVGGLLNVSARLKENKRMMVFIEARLILENENE